MHPMSEIQAKPIAAPKSLTLFPPIKTKGTWYKVGMVPVIPQKAADTDSLITAIHLQIMKESSGPFYLDVLRPIDKTAKPFIFTRVSTTLVVADLSPSRFNKVQDISFSNIKLNAGDYVGLRVEKGCAYLAWMDGQDAENNHMWWGLGPSGEPTALVPFISCGWNLTVQTLPEQQKIAKNLLVPMDISAWVVNKNYLNADPKHTAINIRRAEVNFNKLAHFDSPFPDAFDGESESITMKPNLLGIRIHWTLPESLRRGNQDAKSDSVQFPLVPNRWLVVRLATTANHERKAAAWVLESDFLDPKQGISPYMHPQEATLTRIGRTVPLANWRETSLPPALFLTAAELGEITFSTYQPYSEGVFSFFDPYLAETKESGSVSLQSALASQRDSTLYKEKITQDTLSYFVGGWYSDKNEDPLQKASQLKTVLQTALTERRWETPLETEEEKAEAVVASTVDRIICHGTVSNITWDLNGPKPGIEEESKINLAVGNTPLDALHALAQFDSTIPSDLLKAFNQGLLSKLDEADGAEAVAIKHHQGEFASSPGGIFWHIVAKETDPRAPGVLSPLSPLLIQQLSNLNKLQTETELQEQKLQSLQGELYRAWWKIKKCITVKDVKNLEPSLTEEIKDLKLRVQAQKDVQLKSANDAEQSQLNLGKALTETQFQLKKVAKMPYWQPQDPVALITGIHSDWNSLQGETIKGRNPDSQSLFCRYSRHLIQTVYDDTHRDLASSTSISAHLPAIDNAKLPDDVRGDLLNLIEELFLIDWLQLKVNPNQVKAILPSDPLTPLNPLHFKGHIPAFGFRPWRQPWRPLYIEWQLFWYNIPFQSNWQFDASQEPGLMYETIQAPKPNPQTISGKSLLAPQANFAFKAMLKRVFQQDESMQAAFPNWQTLLSAIDNWDIVSQRLTGFHDRLVVRSIRYNPKPSIVDDKDLCGLLEKCQYDGPSPVFLKTLSPISFHQPVRHGQGLFEDLSVVDQFGQTKDVIRSGDNMPMISTRLITNPAMAANRAAVFPNAPLCLFQLAPRVVQEARIGFQWLQGDESDLVFDQAPATTPICGWIIPNYLDRALQVYTPDGVNLGELRLVDSDKGLPSAPNKVDAKDPLIDAKEYIWQPAPMSPYKTVTELQIQYPTLGKVLNQLKNIIEPKQTNEALFEMFHQAFASTPQTNAAIRYRSALNGRPLALVHTQWQVELKMPPYVNQDWQKQVMKDVQLSDYSFPLKLGSAHLTTDGLIGYFSERDYTKLYTVYATEGAQNDYVTPIGTNHYLTLKPAFGLDLNATHLKRATLLMDPFLDVHGYSDILPVLKVSLPTQFIESALKQMCVTYRAGPLLTPRQELRPQIYSCNLFLMREMPAAIDLKKPKFDNAFIFTHSAELYFISRQVIKKLKIDDRKAYTTFIAMLPTFGEEPLQNNLTSAMVDKLWEIILSQPIPWPVTIPTPAGKGRWSWLEPQADSSWTECELTPPDNTARFTAEAPSVLVEGLLQFSSLFSEPVGTNNPAPPLPGTRQFANASREVQPSRESQLSTSTGALTSSSSALFANSTAKSSSIGTAPVTTNSWTAVHSVSSPAASASSFTT